jgi:formate/nitrite transporter FocA (FNT family)
LDSRSGCCQAPAPTGQAGIGAYFLHFLIPTLIGNTIGGTALVALLNHAPIAEELAGRGMGR